MNLSLYSVQAFVVLDTEGNRVLAKYYRSKSQSQGESKDFLSLKEQKAFEKGLWQKTKKAGGTFSFDFVSSLLLLHKTITFQATSSYMTPISLCTSTLWTSSYISLLGQQRMKSCFTRLSHPSQMP